MEIILSHWPMFLSVELTSGNIDISQNHPLRKKNLLDRASEVMHLQGGHSSHPLRSRRLPGKTQKTEEPLPEQSPDNAVEAGKCPAATVFICHLPAFLLYLIKHPDLEAVKRLLSRF